VSCDKNDKGKLVTKIGDSEIYERDLIKKVKSFPDYLMNFYRYTENGTKQFIDNVVVKETVLINLAKKSGIDKEKEYKRMVKNFENKQKETLEDYKHSLLIKRYLETKYINKDISAQEAKAYYDSHPKQFIEPIVYSVRRILVFDLAAAQIANSRLTNGDIFYNVAKEFSKDKNSAIVGGFIENIKIGDMSEEFEKAVLSLEVGGVSDIVKTPSGYNIINKVSQTKTPTVPFEEAENFIKETIDRDNLNRFIEEETKKLNLEINYDISLIDMEDLEMDKNEDSISDIFKTGSGD
jgi:parvulin-like peptidyl-prolyl isomerase